MDYNVLISELNNDPLDRGYNLMSDQQVVDDINSVYRTVNRAFMTGDEIYNSANTTELQALSDANLQLFLALCGRDNLDPFGKTNVQTIIKIFGGGSDTVSILQDARTTDASRASELGIEPVTLGHILRFPYRSILSQATGTASGSCTVSAIGA